MLSIGKFYYALTPRSEKRGALERVKIVAINEDTITVKTVETLRTEQEYTLTSDKIRSI